MNEYTFSKDKTLAKYGKNSYIAGVLSSIKQKIDAPVKRQKKSE